MKVLLVDDNELYLELMKDVLIDYNFEVTAKNSPIEALEILKEEEFQLLITDFNMPKMNGLKFVETIRKDNLKVTTIIVLSGLSENELHFKEIMSKDPFISFISKDNTLAAIKNHISSRVAKP